MLVKYSDNYQKIVMGFMSYIPELKDLDHLKMELRLYTTDDKHQLLLYKNGSGNFSGIIALEIQQQIVMVRYISLSPSERSTNNIFQVLDEVQKYYQQATIMGSIEITPLILAWKQSKRAN
ncbi:MAG: N-acetyltransferase [Lactobacillus sp.]|jgi:riboflavin biosynthesis RibT protein|uniref:N-acetyltransferase n=1 Tax=Bombilactobacillus bombi TaxID=1303590 RepID=A0A3R6XUR9_9LACO|nr:N-acetyltransferase [Bombilactobacillus bombi]MCO6541335.1 N-acetyltransferase [Lactobacillus sp.]MCO6542852.1 N-acetyltransferase [Lactobacillus sp.]RHW49907.1 N-acetyltransferase [Bombilactobacillus bombi]